MGAFGDCYWSFLEEVRLKKYKFDLSKMISGDVWEYKVLSDDESKYSAENIEACGQINYSVWNY